MRSTNPLYQLLSSIFLLLVLGPVVVTIREGMPVTLQSLVILLVSMTFGWQIGIAAVLAYIMAGVSGLPVFAGYKGGLEALTGPTSGFFLGFFVAAFVTGRLALRPRFQKPELILLNWLIGHSILMICGLSIMALMQIENLGEKALAILPGAAIKSIVGTILMVVIQKTGLRR